jgi:hypothetical protein
VCEGLGDLKGKRKKEKGKRGKFKGKRKIIHQAASDFIRGIEIKFSSKSN